MSTRIPRSLLVALVALVAASAAATGVAGCGSEDEIDEPPAGEERGVEADGPTFDSPSGEQSGQADPLDED